MKRPRQHIIETISSKCLEKELPDEWVARNLSDDYGYDYLIEIFEHNVSTGKTFFIQLKGTDQDIINNEIKIKLYTSNLDYFHKSLLPVLLVFCSTKKNQIWAIWANNLINSLNITENQKSKTIMLDKKNLVNQQFFEKLPKIFSIDIINKINITSYFENDDCKMCSEIIDKYLMHYYHTNVIFNDYTLPKSFIMYYKSNGMIIEVTLIFNQIEKKIEINLLDNPNLLYKPITNYNFIENELKELLANISIILIEVNTSSSLELLRLSISEINEVENLLNIGLVAIKNKEISKYQDLIQETIRLKDLTSFQFLNLVYLFNNSEDNNITDYYQQNIIKIICSIEDNVTKGILYYNLANSYANNFEYSKSLKYYFLARRFNPAYLESFYWFREVGSQLFLKGHYKFAELFYRRNLAITKDNPELFDPNIYALIGDCLFFQCRFSLAKKEFNTFLSKSSKDLSEWMLKYYICDFLIDNNLDNVNINKKNSHYYVEQALLNNNDNKGDMQSLLENSISFMPSNNIAWFNLAIIFNEIESYDLSQNAFLVAALFDNGDKEAWLNCMFLAFYLENYDLFSVILNVLSNKFGEGIMKQITDFIFDQKQLGLEQHKLLFNVIESIFKSISSS